MTTTYLPRRLSGRYVVGRWQRGRWRQESEHATRAVAADRAVYLSGGETEWRNV